MKYFHKVANAHKRCNNIDQLKLQDEAMKDPLRIKGEITGFYLKLYSETSYRRPSSNLINCSMVTKLKMNCYKGSLRSKKYKHV